MTNRSDAESRGSIIEKGIKRLQHLQTLALPKNELTKSYYEAWEDITPVFGGEFAEESLQPVGTVWKELKASGLVTIILDSLATAVSEDEEVFNSRGARIFY